MDFNTRKDYPQHLRRVSFCDLETGKRLVFLTNNFVLPAETIAALYKKRWQVELFFKWIKQNLRIKHFYGASENAVKTQIGLGGVRLCAGRHHQKGAGAGRLAQHFSTDFVRPLFRKNRAFPSLSGRRQRKPIPTIRQPDELIRFLSRTAVVSGDRLHTKSHSASLRLSASASIKSSVAVGGFSSSRSKICFFIRNSTVSPCGSVGVSTSSDFFSRAHSALTCSSENMEIPKAPVLLEFDLKYLLWKSNSCDASREGADVRDEHPCDGAGDRGFEVLGKSTASTEPCERPFDDPTAWQHFESFGFVRALDDLHLPRPLCLSACHAVSFRHIRHRRRHAATTDRARGSRRERTARRRDLEYRLHAQRDPRGFLACR